MQLRAAQLGFQRQGLQHGRRGLVVAAAAPPPSAPSGDNFDRPALRAYVLQLEAFGTVSEEARQAMLEEYRRFEPVPQPAANAPSAGKLPAPAPLAPPAANSSPEAACLWSEFWSVLFPYTFRGRLAEAVAEVAAVLASIAAALEGPAQAACAAAEMVREAVSSQRVDVQLEAGSLQTALLKQAGDQWLQAAVAWGLALNAVQVARQIGPELPAVAEAFAVAADKALTAGAEAAAAAAVAFGSAAKQHEAAAKAAEAAASSQPALAAQAREERESAAAARRSASQALQAALEAHLQLVTVREAAAAAEAARRGQAC